MLRHVLLFGLLLIFSVACTSPVLQPQTTAQETHNEDHGGEEEQHNEDGDDHGHEEEHDDEDDQAHEEEDGDEDHDHKEDEDHREHGAHEHGAAALMIAWSGNDLAIDIQTPAYNVLGFEYAPKTDDEQSLFDKSVATLEAGDFIQLNPDANCAIVSAIVKTELAEETHEDEATQDQDAEEETHSDIDVSYNIQCQQPDELESLDMSQLFAQFPNFVDLQAQWISDVEQSAKSLTSDDAVISFK